MTVVIASRWRALLILGLILAGAAIAVASLTPRPQLPGIGEAFDLVFVEPVFGQMKENRRAGAFNDARP